MKRFVRQFVLLLLWFGADLSVARGQSFSVYRQEVMALYKQGLALMRNGQYARAILKHESALRLVRRMLKQSSDPGVQKKLRTAVSNFSFLLGRCYEKKRSWVRAYRSYRQSLGSEPSERVKEAIQKSLKLVWPRVRVRLRMEVLPGRAKVWIVDSSGRKFYKRSPFAVYVSPGLTKVLINALGYQRYYREFVYKPGASRALRIELSPKRASIQKVFVTSAPKGARLILVDAEGRRRFGTTPWSGWVPAGISALQLTKRGHRVFKKTIVVGSRSNRRFSFRLLRLSASGVAASGRSRFVAGVLGWCGIGVAVAAAVGGAVSFGLASKEAFEYNRKLGKAGFPNEEINAHFSLGTTLNTAGIVAVVMSGVFAATGVGLLVYSRRKRAAAPPKFQSVRGTEYALSRTMHRVE